MPHHGRRGAALAGLLTLAMSLVIAGPAFGSSVHKTVKMQDDCEPVSFNANVPPFFPDSRACVGDGETRFGAFIAEFVARQGSVEDWHFSRDEFGLDAGGAITTVDEGGEPHSFTEVGQFGKGCVPPLDAFEVAAATHPDGTPIDCATEFIAALVRPGTASTVTVTAPGTHLFQCLIHPWMRAVVTVRGEHHGGSDD